MSQHPRTRVLRVGVFATTAVAALVLSGCSGTGGSGDSQTEDTMTFSIGFPISNTVETGYQKLAEQYNEENPDINVEINAMPGESYNQSMRTQLQAGNASDILMTSPGTGQPTSIITLAEAGLIDPLPNTATDLIPKGSDSLFNVDDKTYGQPLDISFVATNFNTTPGVAYPTDFDSVLSTCKDLSAEGKSLYVVAGSMTPNTGIMAMAIAATRVYADNPNWNQDRIDGKVTFADSQGWKDTLQTILDMNDAQCFQKGVEGAGFDAITNGLTQGNSLAMFGPSGTATEINTAADGHASFVVEPFPVAQDGDKAFGLASSNYALSISANSKNKVAAQKFLDWMAEPEQAKAFAEAQGNLPISGYADLDLSDKLYASVEDILKSDSIVPIPNATWPNASVYDSLGAGVQGLFTGQKTIDQVLADMDAAWG